MAYVYESTVTGLFNFTVPGEDRTVQLIRGSKITVKKQLTGNYLNVLRLVKIIEDKVEAPVHVERNPVPRRKPKAKVADKITKVEENVEVKTEDTVTNVKEAEVVEEAPVEKKPAPRRKTTTTSK